MPIATDRVCSPTRPVPHRSSAASPNAERLSGGASDRPTFSDQCHGGDSLLAAGKPWLTSRRKQDEAARSSNTAPRIGNRIGLP
jgi:hypothetical protein